MAAEAGERLVLTGKRRGKRLGRGKDLVSSPGKRRGKG